MKTIRYQIFALLLTGIICSGFQCGEDDYIFPSFDFRIEVELFPEQKEYNIGDTITLSYQIEDMLLQDTFTKAKVLIENGVVPFYLYAGVRHSNYNLMSSPSVFSYTTDNLPAGELSADLNGQRLALQYELGCSYKEENYNIEIKLVPLKAGIYKIQLGDRMNLPFGASYDCEAYNDFYILGNLGYVFNVEDANADILAKSPLPSNVIIKGDDTELRTRKKEIFWFEVK